jgi:integrase
MICFPRKVGDHWHVAFVLLGRQYSATLRTKSEREAERRIGPIRDAIYRVESGQLDVPPGVKPRDFVLAGGRAAPERVDHTATIADLVRAYPVARTDVEANSRRTIAIHLRHFERILGGETRLESVAIGDVERYAAARLAEERRGKATRGYTVRKELRTFRKACGWAPGRLPAPPPTWDAGDVALPKDRRRAPFRTFDQIAALVEQGGDPAEMWETLYLTGAELADLLGFVQASGSPPWVYPMVAFVALTGARRSEMMRSRAEDWDLKAGVVRIREKKRDRKVDETIREIDVHPRLAEAWKAWEATRPKSPHAITIDGGPITPDQASDALAFVLRPHPRWSKVRGFHAFRHSMASILASEGVDQRYIDKILGHQTEEMRARYQHLFPRGVTRAISSLLPPASPAAGGGRDSDSDRSPPG